MSIYIYICICIRIYVYFNVYRCIHGYVYISTYAFAPVMITYYIYICVCVIMIYYIIGHLLKWTSPWDDGWFQAGDDGYLRRSSGWCSHFQGANHLVKSSPRVSLEKSAGGTVFMGNFRKDFWKMLNMCCQPGPLTTAHHFGGMIYVSSMKHHEKP